MDPVIIIPALDPDSRLISLVEDIRRRGFTHIIVIDDGSDPDCRPIFDYLLRNGIRVFAHAKNRGKGQAIKTALRHLCLLYPQATHFVTIDADGQHLPDDLARVIRAAAEQPDHIILGTRRLRGKDVPLRSRFGNAFSSLYFKMDTGATCPDTQTGLRAIPVELIPQALSTPGERYDFEMNFLTSAVKGGIPLAMVPITTVYEDDNRTSHFSTLRDSFLIYRQFFRFAGSSALCAGVDLGLFALVAALISLQTALLVAVATLFARLVSGVLNFTLNRRWSFTDLGSTGGDLGSQARRYLMLFFAQMFASMTLVAVLAFLPLPLVLIKALVDGVLFVASYFIQRNWIFRSAVPTQMVLTEGGDRAHVKTENIIGAL